jgi:hypothetical protein
MNKKANGSFVWRVTYAHVIAYFIAGLFAVTFLGYREAYATASLSTLMRQVNEPIVALGPALQILRGLIIALALLPLKDSFIGAKHGMLKLALLVFGLSAISTIGPTPGSFEGLIYTVLPLKYQLLGLPETAIYIILFCAIIGCSSRANKKTIDVIATVTTIVIVIFSALGYLAASGILKVPA